MTDFNEMFKPPADGEDIELASFVGNREFNEDADTPVGQHARLWEALKKEQTEYLAQWDRIRAEGGSPDQELLDKYDQVTDKLMEMAAQAPLTSPADYKHSIGTIFTDGVLEVQALRDKDYGDGVVGYLFNVFKAGSLMTYVDFRNGNDRTTGHAGLTDEVLLQILLYRWQASNLHKTSNKKRKVTDLLLKTLKALEEDE